MLYPLSAAPPHCRAAPPCHATPPSNQGRANEHAAWRLAVGLGAHVVDQVRACRRTLKVDASAAAHTCGWLQPRTRVLQPPAPTVAGGPRRDARCRGACGYRQGKVGTQPAGRARRLPRVARRVRLPVAAVRRARVPGAGGGRGRQAGAPRRGGQLTTGASAAGRLILRPRARFAVGEGRTRSERERERESGRERM